MDAAAISSTDLDVASLVLRLALGPMLVLHGLNKVQGGLDGTAGWFESLGLKPGWLHARLAAFTEIGAGILVTLGLLNGLGAMAFVGLMTVAALTDHRGKGYFIFKGGAEYVVLVGIVAVALAVVGPGRWSLDHAFGLDLAGLGWGVIALVGGVAAAAGLLVTFYRPNAAQGGRVTTPDVTVTVDGAIGRITFTAPDRLNSLDAAMLETVTAEVSRLDADPAVRVIVFSGEGRAFSAGANIVAYEKVGDLDATLFGLGPAVRAILEARTPIISLVPAVAAGAGLSLALAADYVLVADDAKLLLAFGGLGLMPDGGATSLVVASIGRARALRLALTGEKISGATAAEWGLVSESVAAEGFSARADELIVHLASLAPDGAALTTAAITDAALDLDATLDREERGQHALLRTDDFAEGLAAFREKRPPTFGR